jgi:membrane protein YqaA with SNARE-associated domain
MSILSFRSAVWMRHAEAFSRSKYGAWLLALIAFADSSVLPVMPDVLLVPMILLRPHRMLLLSGICVIASSMGAAVGYGIGYSLWSAIGKTILEIYGLKGHFQSYQNLVHDWGAWIIIAKSFTPIPFKFMAIAAGVSSMNFLTFAIATLIGRALHFGMVALTVALFGRRFGRFFIRGKAPTD